MDRSVEGDENGGGARPVIAASGRRGFLPIVTNWFDRLFIGIYLFVALELLWMRFLEQSVPLTACHLLALGLGAIIVWKG